MPWMESSTIDPPLTSQEREILADGRVVCRDMIESLLVICPRSIITEYGLVTGPRITYGPNGEDAYLHTENKGKGVDLTG